MAPETDKPSAEPVATMFAPMGAVALLVLGLVLPWNLNVGIRIPGTSGWMIALLITVTVLALAVPAVQRADRISGTGSAILSVLLTTPYLVLVGAFTVWTVAVSIRSGGDGTVPPGIGPGAWAGLAGVLLAAQSSPITAGAVQRHQNRVCTVIGWLSMALAALAALSSLYLRTRFVIPGIGGEATAANLATAVAAVFYSAVAIAPVIVVGRGIVVGGDASRLAVTALGASAVVAGAAVWVLPAGRLLDGFHGIAQRTGTSFVGYEGYLAWTAVAAIVGPGVLRAARQSTSLWRSAIRSCLMLIAIWCAGQAVLRITDIVLAGVLNLPTPPYNSTALMAFDLVTAVLAAWLWANSGTRTVPPTATAVLFGTLFALSVCRLVLGVALVPTVEPLNGDGTTAVYGNHLAQQVTSTFDVTLSVLSLALLVVTLCFPDRQVAPPARTGVRPVRLSPPRLARVGRAAQSAGGSSGGSVPKRRLDEVPIPFTQRWSVEVLGGATEPNPTEES